MTTNLKQILTDIYLLLEDIALESDDGQIRIKALEGKKLIEEVTDKEFNYEGS